jgi:hypothetical protein
MSCRSNRRHCRGRKPSYRTLHVERLDDRIPFAADTLPTLIDPSGDGVTSPVDLLVVINADQRRTTAQQFPAADLNRDLSIDGVDVSIAKAGVARASRPEGGWGIGRVGTDDLADLITAGGTTTGTTTGTTPGTTRPEITAQIQIRTKYNASAPLIYNDHTQVKPPTATDDAIYQTTIPFEVMIRYSAFDHGGAHLVRIYASWDGEDEELISERFAASYGEEESIAVVVPTRDADEVTVRAELIGNRNNFVGGGPGAIAGGETTERTITERLNLWDKIENKVERKIFNLLTDKGPQNFAESVLERFAPREESICMMIGEGNLTSIEANHRYDRLRDHLLPVIKGPLADEYTRAWQEIVKSDPVIYQSKAGEKDPRAEFFPKLRETIEGVYDYSLEDLGDELFDHIEVKFADFGPLVNEILGDSKEEFFRTGNIEELDLSNLSDKIKRQDLLKYFGIRIPLTNEEGNLNGTLTIGAENLSINGVKGLAISTQISFRDVFHNHRFQLNTNSKVIHSFNGATTEEINFYLEIQQLFNRD